MFPSTVCFLRHGHFVGALHGFKVRHNKVATDGSFFSMPVLSCFPDPICMGSGSSGHLPGFGGSDVMDSSRSVYD